MFVQQRDVAAAFLDERSLIIPDRPRQLEVLLRVFRFMSRPPQRILDLGAGDGLLLGAVLEAYPEASGVAVDFSPLMLEQAKQRLATQTTSLTPQSWQDEVMTKALLQEAESK